MLPTLALPPDRPDVRDALADRVILVTGSGQGIGRAVALACARQGARVVLHGRRQRKLETVYDAIVGEGLPEPVIVPLDLAKAQDEDYAALASAIAGQVGRLDGIAHCAVHLDELRPLDDEPMTRWLTMLRVNLVAVAAIDRACGPLLWQAPDASIVVTIESHAIAPAAYWGSFAIAKQGLLGLVSITAAEWAARPSVRVNALLPGPVASPQRSRTHPAEDGARLATPESVAHGYVFLLGPQATGLTGRLLDLSAGR
ncbi:MAG: SDR family oxidoreductase [Pseudomonadota bacterium]|jgi:NAD(P)-dependent dehydrogenase (short-subunit alcohol dehydrogenase family)